MTGKVQNRRFFLVTHTHIHIYINIHTDRTKRLTLLRIRAQGNNYTHVHDSSLFTGFLSIGISDCKSFTSAKPQLCSVGVLEEEGRDERGVV